MKSLLYQSEDMSATLSYYSANSTMDAHSHDHHQVSFLLCGLLMEQHQNHAADLVVPSVGIKPAGVVHQNQYGPAGTMILAINLSPESNLPGSTMVANDWQWQSLSDQFFSKQIAAAIKLLTHCKPDQARGCLSELLAISANNKPADTAATPDWLNRVCQQLIEEPNAGLTEVALHNGLHPVYLSRAFSRFMQCTPSVFKARIKLANAIKELKLGASLGDAASSAGYADQAHLTRSARAICGLTPRDISLMLSG